MPEHDLLSCAQFTLQSELMPFEEDVVRQFYVLCVAEIYSEQNKTATLLKFSQFTDRRPIRHLARRRAGMATT